MRFAQRYFSVSEYDLAVIGGGPGGILSLNSLNYLGYVAAIRAAQRGMKTVCIEKRGSLGGTCLNVGCIPSKALLNATHKFHDAQHGFKALGINIKEVSVDFPALMKHKTKVVDGLTGGIEHLFKKNKVDYVKGWGKFASANEITVDLNGGGTQTIKAKHTIIATGSEPCPLHGDIIKTDGTYCINSDHVFSIEKVPKKIVVVGAGVIGLELGSVFQRLGSEVIIVGNAERICPSMDIEIINAYKKILDKQGLKFILSCNVVGGKASASGCEVELEFKDTKKRETITSDMIMVTAGRRPYTLGLQLEKAGLKADSHGKIEIDHNWETSAKGIYAIGDVVKGPMLAHKAEEEGTACVENILGEGGHVNYHTIPGVIYTYPELSSVGKSEEELKKENIAFKKGVFPFMANSRARTNNDAEGMVKILTHAETNKILGIHILGPNAGEMIAEGVLGMEYGATAEDIARTCHAHPTLSEAFKEACMASYDKPIHF